MPHGLNSLLGLLGTLHDLTMQHWRVASSHSLVFVSHNGDGLYDTRI